MKLDQNIKVVCQGCRSIFKMDHSLLEKLTAAQCAKCNAKKLRINDDQILEWLRPAKPLTPKPIKS